MKPIKVLSLFDGMSCGQIALERAKIPVEVYLSSEIDVAAISVTQKNYPNTIQLGDVKYISKGNFDIDLLLGGSPCQGFSFAGKQLNFNDPRSALFFEYVRILQNFKPRYFLLENVKMKQQQQDIITKFLRVDPIEINSALVSGQDRKRLYWTNIPNAGKSIKNKGIIFKDILDVSNCGYLELRAEIAKRYIKNKNYIPKKEKSCVIGRLSKYQGDRVFDINCKASSLSASGGNNGGGGCNIIFCPRSGKLRKLSVKECERLQTVPEGYTSTAKTNQAYKMLGNGWTVDVIVELLKEAYNVK